MASTGHGDVCEGVCGDKAVSLADWPLGFLFTRRNTRKNEFGEKGKSEFEMSTEHLETSRIQKGPGVVQYTGE